MTLPYEWFFALQNTRAVMSEIVATKKMKIDENLRLKIRAATKHLPMDEEMNHIVSVYEKNMAEWGKPEAEKKGYIVISRHDPVEYIPQKMGWVFWFETWAEHSRVYHSEKQCRDALAKYCEELESRRPAPAPVSEDAPAREKPKKLVKKKVKPK
jgi:hypothetical protein